LPVMANWPDIWVFMPAVMPLYVKVWGVPPSQPFASQAPFHKSSNLDESASPILKEVLPISTLMDQVGVGAAAGGVGAGVLTEEGTNDDDAAMEEE
jgi:hypothetical protein